MWHHPFCMATARLCKLCKRSELIRSEIQSESTPAKPKKIIKKSDETITEPSQKEMQQVRVQRRGTYAWSMLSLKMPLIQSTLALFCGYQGFWLMQVRASVLRAASYIARAAVQRLRLSRRLSPSSA